MKTLIRTLALVGSYLAIGTMAQASPVVLWGMDPVENGGWTLTDDGGGNFSVGGSNNPVPGLGDPSGNAICLGEFSPVTLDIGQTLIMSGSLSYSGYMTGGMLRIGLIDLTTPGTLNGTTWTGVNEGAAGYMWALPSDASSIKIGGEFYGHPGGASGQGLEIWASSLVASVYAVPGGAKTNALTLTGATYDFSYALTLTSANAMTITYSFADASGEGYIETGTVTDNGGNSGSVATNVFNAVGFFVNYYDRATNSVTGFPGMQFNNLDVTVTVIPEPVEIALLGLGALFGTFVIRRRR